MTLHEWIIGNDTGISSKTIWAVMMKAIPENIEPFQFDVPHDPSDFGRCYRLLELFPEWRDRLIEVSLLFPKWGPMIENWDRMTQLWEKESPSGSCPQLYDLMQKLEDEGRIKDGWIKKSPGCWEREKEKTVIL